MTINNPTNGQSLHLGLTIGIQSTSTAQDGIRFVQLFVDNVGIETSSPGGFTTSFSVVQALTTPPRSSTVTVSASSTNGYAGQSSIYVNVPNNPTPPSQCVIGSNVVSQGNPPPNTQIQPGTSFQTIVASKNTGTCSWAPSYAVSYVSGNSQIELTLSDRDPKRVSESDSHAFVEHARPQQPGTYNSTWRVSATEWGTVRAANDRSHCCASSGLLWDSAIQWFHCKPVEYLSRSAVHPNMGSGIECQTRSVCTPRLEVAVLPRRTNKRSFLPLRVRIFLRRFANQSRGQRRSLSTSQICRRPRRCRNTITSIPSRRNMPVLGQSMCRSNIITTIRTRPDKFKLRLTTDSEIRSAIVRSEQIPSRIAALASRSSIPTGYRDAVTIKGCIVDNFGNNLACNAGLGIR